MLRIRLLKVESPELRGFFCNFYLLFCKKRVLEPDLENRHRLISVYGPLLAFPNILAPSKGPRCYLKEGLA